MQADLARSLRRLRPSRFKGSLQRRPDTDLALAVVDRLLETRTCLHLSLVLGELSHNFGRLDPSRPQTRQHLAELEALLHDIPPHRVDQDISAGVVLEAGVLAGLVYRLSGFQRGQETAALVDAVLYLQALEKGYVVLTGNLRDFDFMQQILPAGRVLFYRKE